MTNEELREQIAQNNVEQKLEALRIKLICTPDLSELAFSQPDISQPRDPSIFITNAYSHLNIQIKMQVTGKTVIVNLKPKTESSNDIKAFKNEIGSKLKRPYDTTKNGAKYAPAFDALTASGKENIPHLNVAEITQRILETLSRLNDHI